jgi:hypothetical protein
MKREVQGIPPAPRTVRWTAVLAFRWPLAAIALALAGYGGMWTWMLFLAQGGSVGDDERLDNSPTVQVDGKVLLLRSELDPESAATLELVEYEFAYGMPGNTTPTTWHGASFAILGKHHRDDTVRVQLLPAEPNRSRILGERANLTPKGIGPSIWLWTLVVPGFFLGIVYGLGVLRLRRILNTGDVGIARLRGVRRIRFILPEMWLVEFQFRDRNALEKTTRHWVRAHSGLGARLQRIRDGSDEGIPVLHDRNKARLCRLALPEDFILSGNPQPPSPSPR